MHGTGVKVGSTSGNPVGFPRDTVCMEKQTKFTSPLAHGDAGMRSSPGEEGTRTPTPCGT